MMDKNTPCGMRMPGIAITAAIVFIIAGCASSPHGSAAMYETVQAPVKAETALAKDVTAQNLYKSGYDRAGGDKQENTYWTNHFDNAKKSGGSIFFAFDPFSPVDLDGKGTYLGLGGGALFGFLGVWGEFDWLFDKFGVGNDGYEVNADVLGYRFFLGINLNIFKHFSLDAGLGVDGKPKEKTGTGYTGSGKKTYDGHEDPVLNMARAGITGYIGNEAGFKLFGHANYNFDSDQWSCVFGIGLGIWHL